MKLNNCPFCGSSNLDDNCADREGMGERRTFYFVYCNHCQACGPAEYERADAIRLWNERNEGDV